MSAIADVKVRISFWHRQREREARSCLWFYSFIKLFKMFLFVKVNYSRCFICKFSHNSQKIKLFSEKRLTKHEFSTNIKSYKRREPTIDKGNLFLSFIKKQKRWREFESEIKVIYLNSFISCIIKKGGMVQQKLK